MQGKFSLGEKRLVKERLRREGKTGRGARRGSGGFIPPDCSVDGRRSETAATALWRGKPAATTRRDSSRRTFTPVTSYRLQKAGPSSRTPKSTPLVRAPALDGLGKAAPDTGPDDEPRRRAKSARLCYPAFTLGRTRLTAERLGRRARIRKISIEQKEAYEESKICSRIGRSRSPMRGLVRSAATGRWYRRRHAPPADSAGIRPNAGTGQ